MNPDRPEQILASYADAAYKRDVDAMLALYHPQVTVYDMWETWLYDGREAWRSMVEGWFAGLGDERVQVLFEDVRSTVSADLALVHALTTYAGLSAEGQSLRAMNNRLSLTLVREDDQWLILHEHSSAPAHFETGKVNLQRLA